MKARILIVFLLSVTFLQAQKKKGPVKDRIWNDQDPYKDLTVVPEKWANESAVYLVRSVHFDYDRPRNSIEYTKIIRNRIKLLDEAAVKYFSELNYNKDDSYYSYGLSKVTNTFKLGIKIIKPDGTSNDVDTSESIEDGDGYKLAIPGLEKGDIIDYYFYSNSILGENDLYQYKPVEAIIGERYPILNYQFSLHTEKDFFINFNTYNGAPKLEEAPLTAKEKKKKKRKYRFSITDVERNDFPRWYYPFVELPCLKFQVNFARTGKYEKQAYAFIPKESNLIKESVDKNEIFEFYENKFRPTGKLNQIKKFLKNNEFATNEEKVKAIYYFMRHAFFTNYIEAFALYEAKIMTNPFDYYGKNPIYFTKEEQFIRYFTAVLKDEKIDYEIVIGTKRYNGNIKNLLLESNVNFLLKINTENPIYIDFFNQNSTINQIDPLLEDSDGYSLKVVNRKNIEAIETIKLPKSSFKQNNTTEQLNLTIANDFSSVHIDRLSKYLGHNKTNEQAQRLRYYDYIDEDHTKYNTLPILDKVKRKKDKAAYKEKFNALIDKLKEKQKESFKEETADEYSLTLSNHNFEILSNGRFGINDPFEFKESFDLEKDLIKKAGRNYIFEVGKLIGNQIDLDKKEKDRTDNVYMNYPRSFTNNISIAIPEGYTVSGIDKLNKKVENETGGFISSAKIEDGKLVIYTSKHYNHYNEPGSNWPKMVEFLDEANQFMQTKILFKKG